MKIQLLVFGLLLTPACAPVDPNQGFGGEGGGAATTAAHAASAGHGTTGTSSQAGPTGAGNTASSSTATGGNPYDTPPTCSSMKMASGGNNASMKPGSACQSRHVLAGQASGKTFDISGTVYLTAHEPDDCNGVGVSNAVVVITDANNVDTPLPVNSVGNFYHQDFFGFVALKPPLHARVEYDGQTRAMVAEAAGDCDSCHTESGAQNAPGRIMLP